MLLIHQLSQPVEKQFKVDLLKRVDCTLQHQEGIYSYLHHLLLLLRVVYQVHLQTYYLLYHLQLQINHLLRDLILLLLQIVLFYSDQVVALDLPLQDLQIIIKTLIRLLLLS